MGITCFGRPKYVEIDLDKITPEDVVPLMKAFSVRLTLDANLPHVQAVRHLWKKQE